MLPKTNAYVKIMIVSLNQWIFKLKMNFLIKDLLKKYDDVWNKISNNIEKYLTVNSSIFTKLLKTKIRSYGDEATDF